MGFTVAGSLIAQVPPNGQDLAALDADGWDQALKDAVGSASYDAALARDAVRRCEAGTLTVRDLRLLLLGTADAAGWAPARRAAFDVLARDPDKARQVLLTHTQTEVWPPLRFEEAPRSPGAVTEDVTLAAVIGAAGHQVTGPARRARTSRDAKNEASLALLARLAGVPLAGEDAADGYPMERLALPGMLSEVFEQRLRRALETGQSPGTELEEEALRRARTGRLRHRDLHLLILSAPGEAWTAMRSAALERAAVMPPTPATLLHWHAEQHGHDNGLSFVEEPDPTQGRTRVRALLQADRAWRGPLRAASSRKTARHYAAVSLLAQVAELPEPAVQIDDEPAPTRQITIPEQGQDPVKHLNKHHQREAITRPESQVRQVGARVECTYSCRHTASATRVTATGAGPDKVTARRAAALKLLRKLHSLDTAPRTAPAAAAAPRREAPAAAPAPHGPQHPLRPPLAVEDRSVQGLLLAALAAHCPVVFVPAGPGRPAAWWVQDTGRQHLPMTGLPDPLTAGHSPAGVRGWWAPFPEGLHVLRRSHTDPNPTAVFWHRALHIALQLIHAQLLYPALGDNDQATWRVGPLPAPARDALAALAAAAPPGAVPAGVPAELLLTACCDALAETLVRTPAAAVLAAGPWTTPAAGPVTAAALAEVRPWLDRVEDLADAGPPPLLILRVQHPSDDQAAAGQLTADLHLAPATSSPDTDDEVPAEQVWSGASRLGGEDARAVRPRVGRVLRRVGRRYPALSLLQDHPHRFTLDAEALETLLEQERELAEAGLRVVWPQQLRTALQAAAVIGTDTGPGVRTGAGERPRFSVTALLDFRWQVALQGEELSEQEMNALAEAARPLVRVRGQWVLADPLVRRRARHRLLGQLPGTQALTAALTGTLTVADDIVPCRPAGALAEMMAVLTHGEHHPDAVPAPEGLAATLRGYQERALTWLAHTTALGFGAVLADDMGLGKTLTALAFTLHHQQYTTGPTLVICPASLVTNWRRETHRFAPHLPVVDYHGPARTLNSVTDTTVVITTYGVLRRDQALLAGRHWSLVVADEAQHAKNSTSATARQLRALPSTTRLALTGTPVENNLSELWALLDWANPDLFGTLRAFRARWANAAEKDPNGAQAADLNRMISPFLLRRRKSDPGIAPELPAKINQRRVVQLTTEQTALYEAVVRETLQQVQSHTGIARNGLVFKLLTALKQITNHPAHYLREQPPAAPTHGDTAQFVARSAKASALIDLLATIRLRNEATLIFTSYVTMGRLLTAHLSALGHTPVFLHGATPLAERQRMVDGFQAGHHPVMILSLKAGGTGLNLTRAAHVIHYDRSWNAAVEDQATDRAHRIGQHQVVTVHRLITEHTVEDRIDELLTHKRTLADAVLTGGEQVLAQLTDRELADLVRLGGNR
ncbi:DEAD/DEAH box helicase [Streptomyces sp. H10-C2]|uniref:DEAD/DEAH box helicase n=1 Tax=unclassified Streptomyces TaxID=2593676 RepID=UPI0024BBB00D|nr:MULTISPECIES: DEAD/DEAH box helicase [unclassified Streptomyces]MDJ0342843.1 DEAD/DEAH box helicase [Streptomyces sp. PH10-H1]MDJ0372521.1 DEAD/DEAH box helicase [Streptomyces sp. H10-C2]